MDLHFKNNIEEQLQQKDILNDVALSVFIKRDIRYQLHTSI